MNEKELYDRIEDLQQRFNAVLRDLEFLIEELETCKRGMKGDPGEAAREPHGGKSRGRYKKNLFSRNTDLVKRDFNRAYNWFMGEKPRRRLEGNCTDVDFMAYLYLAAYKKGWLDEAGKERNKVPFAKYVREEAFAHLKLKKFSDRTFSNHLTPIMDSCKDLLEKDKNISKEDCKDDFARNFRLIINIV